MTHHTLAILLRDGPDAVHRATSVLRRRAVRFTSLAVSASETPGINRMTLVVGDSDAPQLVKQLDGLVDVVSARDVTAELSSSHTSRMHIEAPSYLAQGDGAPGWYAQ